MVRAVKTNFPEGVRANIPWEMGWSWSLTSPSCGNSWELLLRARRQCASRARLICQLSNSAIVIKVLTLSLEMGCWC